MGTVSISSLLVSCLEEEPPISMEEMDEKIDGQRHDISRIKRIIAAEKVRLADFEQAGRDLEETKTLTVSLEETLVAIKEGRVRNSDLSDAVVLTQLELDQYQARYRAKIRKEAIGKNIDLSATKGDNFQSVRIMATSPLAIKVYTPSGPETIRLKELTPEIREMLQMSEEEIARYIERKGEDAAARAKKFKEWKEGQSKRDKEESNEAIVQKIKDLKEEIYKRENAINIRIKEMKGWKEKASYHELQASRERREGKRPRKARYADLARAKAETLADLNSDSWIVIGRLKAELEDLKRMGIR